MQILDRSERGVIEVSDNRGCTVLRLSIIVGRRIAKNIGEVFYPKTAKFKLQLSRTCPRTCTVRNVYGSPSNFEAHQYLGINPVPSRPQQGFHHV